MGDLAQPDSLAETQAGDVVTGGLGDSVDGARAAEVSGDVDGGLAAEVSGAGVDGGLEPEVSGDVVDGGLAPEVSDVVDGGLSDGSGLYSDVVNGDGDVVDVAVPESENAAVTVEDQVSSDALDTALADIMAEAAAM